MAILKWILVISLFFISSISFVADSDSFNFPQAKTQTELVFSKKYNTNHQKHTYKKAFYSDFAQYPFFIFCKIKSLTSYKIFIKVKFDTILLKFYSFKINLVFHKQTKTIPQTSNQDGFISILA